MEYIGFHSRAGSSNCIGVDPYYLTHKAEAVGHSQKYFSRDVALMMGWVNILLEY